MRYDIRLAPNDIISIPSYAVGTNHPPKEDIISKIYHPFTGTDIIEKPLLSLTKEVFLGGECEIRTHGGSPHH